MKDNNTTEMESGSSKLEVNAGVGAGRDHAMKRKARATRWLEERAWRAGRHRPVVDLADALKAVEMEWTVKLK